MGIYEYFEKRQGKEEDLNIYNLTIKESKKKPELPFDQERDIFDSDQQVIKEKLEQYRQNKDWGYFSGQAMEMKILFPEKTKELNLDKEAWQGIKEKLEQDRQNKDWGSFSGQAMEMKILAAKEVRITDEGLRAIMPQLPKEFREEKIPRPERRQF